MIVTDVQIKQLLPANESFTAENLQEDITTAFNRYVKPAISKAQYDESLTKTDEPHPQFIDYCQKAAVFLGVTVHFAQLKVHVGDTGITYQGNQETSRQATAQDKEDLFKSFRNKGYQYLEDALQLLDETEANTDTKGTFQKWIISPAYTRYNEFLIRNAHEFDLINGQMLIFQALKPHIKFIETTIINEVYPAPVIDDLREALKDNTLDTPNPKTKKQVQLLNDYLRPAISYLALAKSISANAIGKDQDGIFTIYDADDSTATRSKRDVSNQKLTQYALYLKESGEKYLQLATAFIQKNEIIFGIAQPNTESEIKIFINTNEGIGFF